MCTAGDPVEAVLLALEAAEKVFGVEVNSLGYKVPKSCGVIQGDGINIQMLDKILQAVLNRGYSAQVCVALLFSHGLFSVLLLIDSGFFYAVKLIYNNAETRGDHAPPDRTLSEQPCTCLSSRLGRPGCVKKHICGCLMLDNASSVKAVHITQPVTLQQCLLM